MKVKKRAGETDAGGSALGEGYGAVIWLDYTQRPSLFKAFGDGCVV